MFKVNKYAHIKGELTHFQGKKHHPIILPSENSFPALSVYPRVVISQSASETDDRFYSSKWSLILNLIESVFGGFSSYS